VIWSWCLRCEGRAAPEMTTDMDLVSPWPWTCFTRDDAGSCRCLPTAHDDLSEVLLDLTLF